MNQPIYTPPPTKLVGGKPMTKWDLLASQEPTRSPWLGGQPKPNHGLAEDEDYGVEPYVKRVT